MSEINFSKADTELLVTKLQAYCSNELEMDLGDFDAQFLLDFISKELGSYYYNQGVYDAQAILQLKTEEISDSLLQLEKIVK
ncbi:MAG: DUF2164 domain-containing protein [Aestuariibacter sp.]